MILVKFKLNLTFASSIDYTYFLMCTKTEEVFHAHKFGDCEIYYIIKEAGKIYKQEVMKIIEREGVI